MTGNPFEGRLEQLANRLERRGFGQALASVGDGVVLSYLRGPAHGPPLVLIPAQMGTWRTYQRVAADLSENFEVFAMDVTGHGASSWTPGRYTWDIVGEQLRRFLETVVGRPAIVSGNSSGGIFGLWLAARAPDAVAGLILEDAPVFSVEWPRFRDRDRFVYQGLVHAVEVLGNPDRRLADYFRGQVLPVSERRTKRFPDWLVDLIDRGVRRWELQHPNEPSGFSAWWAPSSFGDLFRSLSMFDPDFARAFVDGRMYGDFSHAEALRTVSAPILLIHARWLRLESPATKSSGANRYRRTTLNRPGDGGARLSSGVPYGLVGALDDDDVQRVRELAPQTRVVRSTANHVVHRYDHKLFVRELRAFGADVAAR